jgi:hypothetical protein
VAIIPTRGQRELAFARQNLAPSASASASA